MRSDEEEAGSGFEGCVTFPNFSLNASLKKKRQSKTVQWAWDLMGVWSDGHGIWLRLPIDLSLFY